ncbi:hypothetical protein MCUN1_002447 [Malassezia cuniculi]|uniref:Uncharacterized protein n=1 Tax=Malassezia cuniculi TaxID=948313 RepID=A0AAF0EWG3_9BASI|nr:hypothetical protein MCUN1_002447 [Malassezia cuniculi]
MGLAISCAAAQGSECVFSLYYHARIKSLQMPVRGNRPSLHRVVTVFEHVLKDGLGDTLEEQEENAKKFMECNEDGITLPKVKQPLDVDDPRARWFRENFKLWFLGLKEEHITRADVEQWISWALTGRHREELQDASTNDESGYLNDLLEQGMALVEARRGLPFPKKVELTKVERSRRRMMLLSLDPVRVRMHPLGHYVLMKSLNLLHLRYLKLRYGLKVFKCGRISYFYYAPRDWTEEEATKGNKPLPLLFLHGLGVGHVQYCWSLAQFLAPGGKPAKRPFIMPIQPWIANDIFSHDFLAPWDAIEASETIRGILRRHDITRVNIVSHSKGTITHTWIIKNLADVIVRSCFVDPVPFELWNPYLCYRFMYKKPETGIEIGLRYFVARELGTAFTLSRHFNWSTNVLLPHEDFTNGHDPNLYRFYIAGDDSVFSAPHIRAYLKRNGIVDNVHYYEGLPHGALIMTPNSATPEFVAWLDEPMAA